MVWCCWVGFPFCFGVGFGVGLVVSSFRSMLGCVCFAGVIGVVCIVLCGSVLS